MDHLRVFWSGGLAGTYRPYGLIRENCFIGHVGWNPREAGLGLTDDNFESFAGLMLLRSLADAHYRGQLMLEGGDHFFVHEGVALQKNVTPLRVSDDHVGHAERLEHRGRG